MKPTTPSHRALWLVLLTGLGLSAAPSAACGNPTSPAVTPTPTRTPRPTAPPTPLPTPTPAWPVAIFVPGGLPAPVADAVNAAIAERPDLFTPALSAAAADVQVTLNLGPDVTPLAEWVYAVVAPFPTLTDEVAWGDVTGAWDGAPSGLFADRQMLMTQDTRLTLVAMQGEISSAAPITVVAPDQIVQRA